MRTRNLLMLWLLGAFALPALATAQVVQAVSVSQERGQTLISITGERLPRPSVKRLAQPVSGAGVQRAL
jgi:hypothetical protein